MCYTATTKTHTGKKRREGYGGWSRFLLDVAGWGGVQKDRDV